MRASVLLAAIALLCTSCGHQASYVWVDDLDIEPREHAPYRIQAGDELRVRVWNQDPLSVDARVRPDGHISVPLVGDVGVAGLTPAGAAAMLDTRLDGLVREPKVVVTVLSARPHEVSVVGEVKSAGRYPLERGDTVLDMLARAGGLTEFASPDEIYVMRRGPDRRRVRFSYEKLSKGLGKGVDFTLEDGDVIVVE